MYSHFLFPIWHSVFLPVTLPQWDRGGWGDGVVTAPYSI